MSWREFCYYLHGLDGRTPLGRIVCIRAEDDPERLKEFTREEKRIRAEYRTKKAKEADPQKRERVLKMIQQAFEGMAVEKT